MMSVVFERLQGSLELGVGGGGVLGELLFLTEFGGSCCKAARGVIKPFVHIIWVADRWREE